MRRVVALLIASGCLFPDTSSLQGDASLVDAPVDARVDSLVDTAVDAPFTCDPANPFTTITLVPGILASSAQNPRLSLDELEIFYQVYGDAGLSEVVHATRAAIGAPFGAATFLDTLDTAGDNWDQMLSADGVTLVYASDRAGKDAIYRATRGAPTSSFGTPVVIPGIVAPYEQDKPYIQGNNVAIWYLSYESGQGDIYVAQSVAGDYGAGVAESELNTPDVEEGFPVVNADATLIYFYRTEPADAGGRDQMWMARRPNAGVPFGAPVLVSELNATGGDVDPAWLSPDLCRLYFTSKGSGSALPYVASRTH